MAPTLLLSVSVRCTEHQNLIGEAWERAPLLERGVHRSEPVQSSGARTSSWVALGRPQRRLSALHRFQLRALWDDTGLQIPPQRD
jgi:hypothetical protein